MNFSDLGLLPQIVKALDAEGYERPSPIQEAAIPPVLAGRDVLGCAQTGTGKTCAFAAPILQRLSARGPAREKGRPVRALILTPTRELALQIQESFAAYGRGLPLRSAVIFGGVGQNPQVESLRRGVDILVATPGRLLDLHGQGLLTLSGLEILVLDEADRMLDMGFIHDVRRILKLLPEKKQTLFFSATMPPEVTELVNALLKNPVRVAVDPVSSPVEVIRQSVYPVDKGNKSKLLAKLILDGDVKNALVFTRTKHGANKVAGELQKAGISAAAIHGNKSQASRQQALADFKAGHVRALVATDIAARGIDIEELSHVFNYNLPEVAETYVHRIGRTGRAGHGGSAVSFCDFGEKPYLRDIEKLIGKAIPEGAGNPWPMEVFVAAVKDARGRPVNADDAEARAAARVRKAERAAAGAVRTEKPGAKAPAAPKAPPREKPAAPPSNEGARAPAPNGQSAPRRRGQRQGKLQETAPAAPQMPQTEFHRRDPLATDVILDATARLLAPKPRPAAAPAGRREEPPRAAQRPAEPARQSRAKETPPPKKQDASLTENGVRRTNRGKTANGPAEAPKGQATPASEKRTPGSPQKAATAAQRAEKEPGRFARRRRQPEPPRPGGQKDSTEQPSLMKPYYLNRDD